MKNAYTPAMPCSRPDAFPGLTKREYFAAMAMQGVMASDHDGAVTKENCVRMAVDHADALLAELEKAK